jgi:hypothetical protein
LIERHVVRVVVKPQTLDICLIPTSEAQAENPSLAAGGARRMQNIRRIRQKGDTKTSDAMTVRASGYWQALPWGSDGRSREEPF